MLGATGVRSRDCRIVASDAIAARSVPIPATSAPMPAKSGPLPPEATGSSGVSVTVGAGARLGLEALADWDGLSAAGVLRSGGGVRIGLGSPLPPDEPANVTAHRLRSARPPRPYPVHERGAPELAYEAADFRLQRKNMDKASWGLYSSFSRQSESASGAANGEMCIPNANQSSSFDSSSGKPQITA